MNKKILITITAILVIVISISIFLFSRNVPAEASDVIILVRESGAVSYKLNVDDEYQDMDDDEISLPSGSFIKTGEDAYTRVFLPDNSLISIDQQSEIQIKFVENKINIDQFIGKTWNRVQSVTQGGEYTVKTPNTIAAVRGTVFIVEVDKDGNSKIYVTDGDVTVDLYQLIDGNEEIIDSIELTFDMVVETIDDGTNLEFDRYDLNESLKNQFWFQRNLIIDQFYFDLLKNEKETFKLSLTLELQNYEGRSMYLFDEKAGNNEITVEELEESLSNVIDITNIDESTCENNTSDDFFNARDQLNAYSEHVENYGILNNFLLTLEDVCTDQFLSGLEIQTLQSQINDFN